MLRSKVLSVVLLALHGVSAFADPVADYTRLQEWRTGAPTSIGSTGVEIRHLDAGFDLDSGMVRLQEPTADGSLTGLTFEGQGTFRLKVADPFELEQLRRLCGDEDLTELEESFSKMVLRTSDSALVESLGVAPKGPFRPDKAARERHDFWLRIRRLDADAKVMSARLNPGESFLRVDVKTERFGWLTYDYNSRRHEEVRLEHFNKRYSFLEYWLSLDRPDDRRASGRPGAIEERELDILHVDLEVSLLRLGKDPGTSETSRHTVGGDFVARVDVQAKRPGLRALQFYLHPFAKVLAVRDADGRPLGFLRDNIGTRSSTLDKRIFDHSLVILSEEPLESGVPIQLEIEYEFEVRNYMPGRGWYPGTDTIDTALRDLHTASLTVTTRERYDVRAMGEAISESTEDGLVTRSWRIEQPVKMVTFASARKVQEHRLEAPRVPEVVVFATPFGSDSERRLGEIAADVQESLAFYQDLLGVELPTGVVQTTLIQGGHGQAFDGFLHLAEQATFRERTGPIELFIAHEVAHQWAGHLIGWGSYRDQWLSEGLSQYLALLYLRERVPKGEELFLEAIRAHTDEITGSIKSQMSPFARGSLPLATKQAEGRLGPISHGYRASVGESPGGYLTQSYRKGALVLHLVHEVVRASDAGDEAFTAILRDFFSTHRGGYPSTDDFQAAVERHSELEWDQFFDLWVRGTAIPKYAWKEKTKRLDSSGYRIELAVSREDVPEAFVTWVPVDVEFSDGTTERRLLTVTDGDQVLTIDVAEEPARVVFNPGHAVPARMKRK